MMCVSYPTIKEKWNYIPRESWKKMKKNAAFLLFMGFCLNTQAQVHEFTLDNGLKVLVKENIRKNLDDWHSNFNNRCNMDKCHPVS